MNGLKILIPLHLNKPNNVFNENGKGLQQDPVTIGKKPVTVDLKGMESWNLDRVRPPYGRCNLEKSDGVFS